MTTGDIRDNAWLKKKNGFIFYLQISYLNESAQYNN